MYHYIVRLCALLVARPRGEACKSLQSIRIVATVNIMTIALLTKWIDIFPLGHTSTSSTWNRVFLIVQHFLMCADSMLHSNFSFAYFSVGKLSFFRATCAATINIVNQIAGNEFCIVCSVLLLEVLLVSIASKSLKVSRLFSTQTWNNNNNNEKLPRTAHRAKVPSILRATSSQMSSKTAKGRRSTEFVAVSKLLTHHNWSAVRSCNKKRRKKKKATTGNDRMKSHTHHTVPVQQN